MNNRDKLIYPVNRKRICFALKQKESTLWLEMRAVVVVTVIFRT